MKPIINPKATEKVLHSERRFNLPAAPRHVEIDFLPHSDWTIEVEIPWPANQLHRNHNNPTARPTMLAHGFAPIELVIAAALEQRRQQCRISLGAYFENQL